MRLNGALLDSGVFDRRIHSTHHGPAVGAGTSRPPHIAISSGKTGMNRADPKLLARSRRVSPRQLPPFRPSIESLASIAFCRRAPRSRATAFLPGEQTMVI